MSETYKVGKGRGTKTVTARQYLRDQDFGLARWAGRVQVHRDHFRIVDGQGFPVARAEKGDWLVRDEDGTLEVVKGREFLTTYREVGE